jgi:NAD-dependent SIR2 family protein deacetylase
MPKRPCGRAKRTLLPGTRKEACRDWRTDLDANGCGRNPYTRAFIRGNTGYMGNPSRTWIQTEDYCDAGKVIPAKYRGRYIKPLMTVREKQMCNKMHAYRYRGINPESGRYLTRGRRVQRELMDRCERRIHRCSQNHPPEIPWWSEDPPLYTLPVRRNVPPPPFVTPAPGNVAPLPPLFLDDNYNMPGLADIGTAEAQAAGKIQRAWKSHKLRSVMAERLRARAAAVGQRQAAMATAAASKIQRTWKSHKLRSVMAERLRARAAAVGHQEVAGMKAHGVPRQRGPSRRPPTRQTQKERRAAMATAAASKIQKTWRSHKLRSAAAASHVATPPPPVEQHLVEVFSPPISEEPSEITWSDLPDVIVPAAAAAVPKAKRRRVAPPQPEPKTGTRSKTAQAEAPPCGQYVFVLGAGASAALISTFRGSDDLFKRALDIVDHIYPDQRPRYLDTLEHILSKRTLFEHPEVLREVIAMMARAMENKYPTDLHMLISDLIRDNTCGCVITTNVDGLEFAAGMDPDKVWPVHGNIFFNFNSLKSVGLKAEGYNSRTSISLYDPAPNVKIIQGVIPSGSVWYSDAQEYPIGARDSEEIGQIISRSCLVIVGASMSIDPWYVRGTHPQQLIVVNTDQGAIREALGIFSGTPVRATHLSIKSFMDKEFPGRVPYLSGSKNSQAGALNIAQRSLFHLIGSPERDVMPTEPMGRVTVGTRTIMIHNVYPGQVVDETGKRINGLSRSDKYGQMWRVSPWIDRVTANLIFASVPRLAGKCRQCHTLCYEDLRYCPEHLMQIKKLYIGPSRIENAGEGLYALAPGGIYRMAPRSIIPEVDMRLIVFKKDDVIDRIYGEELTDEQMIERYYDLLNLQNKSYVEDIKRGRTHYFNDNLGASSAMSYANEAINVRALMDRAHVGMVEFIIMYQRQMRAPAAQQLSPYTANVEIFADQPQFFVATRNIFQGEELLRNYGADYWASPAIKKMLTGKLWDE